jgi:hypothetical protein
MAICYLILCHNSAAFVADLFRSLHDEQSLVLLHADAKAPAELHDLVGSIDARFANAHALPSRSCSWGGYSLTAVTLEAIAFALNEDAAWTHFVLLSEQHLPLLSTAELCRRLEPDVSYAEAHLVAAMYPLARDDITHRIYRNYRELPGVGAFAEAPRHLPEAWLAQLHHGSQWLVLSAQACEFLLAVARDTGFWQPFTRSLLSDEIAFPTALMAGVRSGRLTLKNWNPSFIATPGAGGTTDMVFTEANHHAALAAGKWFIRKRPAILPDSVRYLHEQNCRLREAELATTRTGPSPPGDAMPAAARNWPPLRDAFVRALRIAYPDVVIELVAGVVHCPDCYLVFRLPHWPPEAIVCLLSSDFIDFKVLSVLRQPFDGSYRDTDRAGRALSVIKARVYGLFSYREVVMDEAQDFGFCTVRSAPDMLRLAYIAAACIAETQRLVDRTAGSGGA